MPELLKIRGLDASYGGVQVLRGVSLDLGAGEVLCLLGRNGAGKTTLLKTIMGLVRATAGSIMLDGSDLAKLPAHEVPRQGVAYVPQGRRLFAEMTVAENIEIGLMTRGKGHATRGRCSTSSRCCASGFASGRARCRAASSRCWPWRARWRSSPGCCSSTSRPRA
jgi:branched-chain amino acid transport system ATP-binding protein